MKVLFICRANVGRSQMAEAMFNNLTKAHIASSAGLNPPQNWEGEKLSKTKFVAPCMAEISIDVSEKISKKITEPMVIESNKIIVIGERENWPSFLLNSGKVDYWDIADPDTGGMDLHRTVRDQIKSKVNLLIKDLQ